MPILAYSLSTTYGTCLHLTDLVIRWDRKEIDNFMWNPITLWKIWRRKPPYRFAHCHNLRLIGYVDGKPEMECVDE
jgi:hypothetical protein